MRSVYLAELEELNKKLIFMGMHCENAVAKSAQALIKMDRDIAREVVEKREDIKKQEREIEDFCLRLLVRQQPVAKDLRMISSALKMVTDMERIGDQSTDIADIVNVCSLKKIPEGLDFKEMSDAVIHMVTKSIDAFVKQDQLVANEVIRYDDIVDNYFDSIRGKLAELLKSGANATDMLDLLMVAKYFERTGDHAANIANWVLFSITGELKGVHTK
ncbi:MAG: phosphate signaling complex protein PhoU [Bilifractor sp.]|jgi:phosphate transport system protein